ncbi:MAG TPA: RHS repeat domain-containing protein [Streptosporangiaceae bacterium]|nr:RHS repeat domain-containing protein [Streptosporangiaceae bacterium]
MAPPCPRPSPPRQDYNLNHWPTLTTDAAGFTTLKSYDLDGLVTSVTDQNGNTTKYTLDPRGDLIQAMVPHTS